METRLNYILLGVFFITSLVALSAFIFWAGKYNRNLNAYHKYYLYSDELPKGIRTETPVRYLGLPVGFVESYTLNAEQNQVEITLWIKREIILNEGTQAMLDSQGLTGGSYIAIVQGDGPPLNVKDKPILKLKKNWVEKVGRKTEAVFEQLEISLERLNILLNEKNLKNIENTLQNLELASGHFDNVLGNLNAVLLATHKEIRGFQSSRLLIQESFTRGDYNLRAILTPLVYGLEQNSKTLERVLLEAENAMEDFSKSPSGFFFGTQESTLGPREK